MWAQQWGTMIWGQIVSVPALGFWGLLALGALLGIVGVRCLRGARPRTLGAMALALAILIPISVRAVPFTFTNGTLADANQVNANFAAVTPITGFFNTRVSGPFASTTDIFTPAFVAPRGLTCVVHLDTRISLLTATPAGGGSVQAAESTNGVVALAFAPPVNSAVGMGMVSTVIGGNDWSTSQTRSFTAASGASIQFGCRVATSGDFASTTGNLTCVTVYECY